MRPVFALLLLAGAPSFLAAQGVSVGFHRWLKSPRISEYRVGIGGFGSGLVRITYSAQFLQQAGSSRAHWYGGGADLIIRATPTAQPYFLAGAAAGAGRGPGGG
ncbi:MAG: hypothetical protein HOP28_05340, partial [Gemmatimonadales bacterium]|nr:hypothetical protein [Gemmatimonadales bacterium]